MGPGVGKNPWREFEQQLDRNMTLLSGLRSPELRPEAFVRVVCAAVREADRGRRRGRWLGWVRWIGGAAAALLAATALPGPFTHDGYRPGDLSDSLESWTIALDESDRLLSGLGDWPDSLEAELDRYFDSLDGALRVGERSRSPDT
jgi:hypothetical protein